MARQWRTQRQCHSRRRAPQRSHSSRVPRLRSGRSSYRSSSTCRKPTLTSQRCMCTASAAVARLMPSRLQARTCSFRYRKDGHTALTRMGVSTEPIVPQHVQHGHVRIGRASLGHWPHKATLVRSERNHRTYLNCGTCNAESTYALRFARCRLSPLSLLLLLPPAPPKSALLL